MSYKKLMIRPTRYDYHDGKAPKVFDADRSCLNCGKKLSRYNPEPFCYNCHDAGFKVISSGGKRRIGIDVTQEDVDDIVLAALSGGGVITSWDVPSVTPLAVSHAVQRLRNRGFTIRTNKDTKPIRYELLD